MTTQEAIDLMKLMLSDNDEIYSIKEIEALEIVIKAAEKSIKYRKKAKRFKRKWLGLRSNINNAREQINYNANYCYFDYTNIDELRGYQDGLDYALSVIRECLGEE